MAAPWSTQLPQRHGSNAAFKRKRNVSSSPSPPLSQSAGYDDEEFNGFSDEDPEPRAASPGSEQDSRSSHPRKKLRGEQHGGSPVGVEDDGDLEMEDRDSKVPDEDDEDEDEDDKDENEDEDDEDEDEENDEDDKEKEKELPGAGYPEIAASGVYTIRAALIPSEQQAQNGVDAINHFWHCLPDVFLRHELHPQGRLHAGSQRLTRLSFREWPAPLRAGLENLAHYVLLGEAEEYIETAWGLRQGGQPWLVAADVNAAIKQARKDGRQRRDVPP